jgi:hypothetical protein
MEHSEILNLREGTLVRYWRNGWHAAYFEKPKQPRRPKTAVLIPPMLGKRRIEVPIQDIEQVRP